MKDLNLEISDLKFSRERPQIFWRLCNFRFRTVKNMDFEEMKI